jgi:Fic family protein
MLRWEEKEDVGERYQQVEAVVNEWRERESQAGESLRDEFQTKLLISWIFHDSALEGEVLSYSEIKAATDRNIISDVSLIPAYEDIKAFDNAARFCMEYAGNKKKPINLDLLRQIFTELSPGEDAKGAPYRKENPLHRLYYHEIAPPEKVSYRMRKFGEWLDSTERKDDHPLALATHTHRTLMGIFPWPKATGKVARLLSNLILLRNNFPLAVIHSIDRQRYYDALRTDDAKLELLYLEAVETTAQSAIRVYEEADARKARRGRRAS